MTTKTLVRYGRLMKEPPTWETLHRRRALYNHIMDDMRERLRLFGIFGALSGHREPEDTLQYAYDEMRQLIADIKAQAGEEGKGLRQGVLSPAQQMLSAAAVEALLKYDPAWYKAQL